METGLVRKKKIGIPIDWQIGVHATATRFRLLRHTAEKDSILRSLIVLGGFFFCLPR